MLVTAPSLVAAKDTGEDEAAAQSVRATMMSLAASYVAGDLDAAGRLFADGPGVHIIEGAVVNHGWADHRDHHLDQGARVRGLRGSRDLGRLGGRGVRVSEQRRRGARISARPGHGLSVS